MMSTAMVVPVGTELGAIRPVGSEREGGEGMSFAESFGERAGLSIDGEAAGASVQELKPWKSEGLQKGSEDSGLAPNGVQGKRIVGQEVPKTDSHKDELLKGSEPKNTVVVPGNIVPRGSSGAAGEHRLTLSEKRGEMIKGTQTAIPQKAMIVDPATTEDELEPKGKEAEEPSLTAPKPSADMGSTNLKSLPHESVGVMDRSSDVESLGRKKVVAEKKGQDPTSVKKTDKTNGATGLKTIGGAEVTKGSVVPSMDVAAVPGTTAVQQNVLPGDGQQNDVEKMDHSAPGELLATAVKPVEGPGVSHSKEIALGKRSAVEDGGDATNAALAQSLPTKPGGDSSAPAVGPASGGKDSDANTTSSLAAVTVVHPGPGGAGGHATAPESASGVAIGHASTDVVAGKIQTAEAAAHPPNSQAEAAEQTGAAAAEMGGMHRIVTATPTTLEIGVANGTQGWLKIRAEMSDSGQVNASLSSATSAGQEMLHRELPALTAYLHQERVPVNAVVVHSNAATGTGSMPAGDMNPEGRGQQPEREGAGEQRQGNLHVDSDGVDRVTVYEGLSGPGLDGSLSSGMFPEGGGYLNVRA
jgi:hypothetical protein